MVSLAKDTVEDSATVRVVTIVTLIYLPASFVSVRTTPLQSSHRAKSSVVAAWNESVRFPNIRWIGVPGFQAVLDFCHYLRSTDFAYGWKLVFLYKATSLGVSP